MTNVAENMVEALGPFEASVELLSEVRSRGIRSWMESLPVREALYPVWISLFGLDCPIEEDSDIDEAIDAAIYSGWSLAVERIAVLFGIDKEVFGYAIEELGEQKIDVMPDYAIGRLRLIAGDHTADETTKWFAKISAAIGAD